MTRTCIESNMRQKPPNAGCERNHESVRLKYYY